MFKQSVEIERRKLFCTLEGCSGSGKTLNALMIAQALSDNTYLIDVAESGLSRGYDDKFPHSIAEIQGSLKSFFSACELLKKMEEGVVIVDSLSSLWERLLEWKADMDGEKSQGSQWTNWDRIGKQWSKVISSLQGLPMHHVLACVRQKEKLDLTDKKNPRKVPEQSIWKPETEFSFHNRFQLRDHFIFCVQPRGLPRWQDQEWMRLTPELAKEMFA